MSTKTKPKKPPEPPKEPYKPVSKFGPSGSGNKKAFGNISKKIFKVQHKG